MTVGGHVDQTNSMLFTRGKLHLILLSDDRTGGGRIPGIHTVEQRVIGRAGMGSLGVVGSERGCVIMILYSQWSHVNVPVCARRSVDDKGSNQTVGVLQREMTVVPCSSVGRCTKRIGER